MDSSQDQSTARELYNRMVARLNQEAEVKVKERPQDGLQIFSVYDVKAEGFLQPFFAPRRGVAVRSFSQAVNDEGHEFHRHAEDYSLWVIGHFDTWTGTISSFEPERLIAAKECIEN